MIHNKLLRVDALRKLSGHIRRGMPMDLSISRNALQSTILVNTFQEGISCLMYEHIGILSQSFQRPTIRSIPTYNNLPSLPWRLHHILLPHHRPIRKFVTATHIQILHHRHDLHRIPNSALHQSLPIPFYNRQHVLGLEPSRSITFGNDVSHARDAVGHGSGVYRHVVIVEDVPDGSSVRGAGGVIVVGKYVLTSFNFSKVFVWLQIDHGSTTNPTRGILPRQSLHTPLPSLTNPINIRTPIPSGTHILLQLKVKSSIPPMTLLPLGSHRNVHQLVHPVRRHDPAHTVPYRDPQPHPQPLRSVDLHGRIVPAPIRPGQTQQSRQTERVIPVTVRYKNLRNLSGFDGRRLLNGKLRRFSSVEEPRASGRTPFFRVRSLLRLLLLATRFIVLLFLIIVIKGTTAPPIQSQCCATHPPRHARSTRRRTDEHYVHIALGGICHHGMVRVSYVVLADCGGYDVIYGGEVAVFDVGGGDALEG
mmetsp:Transcript_17196/g.36134  ORF Transcript_17196/g.36134 Transcript_17196/m.36134 type:complete len:477 (+) Transcript_17196:260-1690(+)